MIEIESQPKAAPHRPADHAATAEAARLVAQALCEFTQARLWVSALASPALYLNHELHCRPGHGRATYHRFDSARRRHNIVFGQKMVLDKWQSALNGTAVLERWLTVREIRRHGFFDGLVTLETALLQTCLHEFAHLLQTVDRKRRYGSVHNRAFYEHLQRLHFELDLDLESAELRSLLPTELVNARVLQQAVEKPNSPGAPDASHVFAVGDLVVFRFRQRSVRAVILKRNRVTYKLQGRGAHRGMVYRCHPSLLSPDPAGQV